ncbi:MAG: DinB family protein, partial [Gemmatimonadota bacterium]
MHAEAAQCSYLLHLSQPWLAALGDDDLAWEPAPGTKTAGWLVGHLVITGDYARRLCGLSPIAPAAWRPIFAPGTVPASRAADYPRMSDLAAA